MDSTHDPKDSSQTTSTPRFVQNPAPGDHEFWAAAPLWRASVHNPKIPITRPAGANSSLLVLLFILLLEFPPANTSAAEPADHAVNQLTPEQAAEGWISLFDGETLFGWTPTSNANWRVEDGAVTVSEGEPGFLATNAEFANYELRVEFKAPASSNSGVFLRAPLKPTDPTKDCIELNIAPRDNPFPTASLVGRAVLSTTPAAVYGGNSITGFKRIGKQPAEIDAWDGEWHTFHVSLEGNTIQITLDGHRLDRKLLSILADGTSANAPRRGRISLQFREGAIAFRNIRLLPLDLKPMLNGRDLAGWNTDEARESKFEIVPPDDSSGPLPLEGRAGEGGEAGTRSNHPSLPLPVKGRGPEDTNGSPYELRVTGGSGQLESDAFYGDFTFQFDCRIDGDGLNSGVFFRCIPRQYMQGYECQIHNGMKGDDPTRPTDFGTGAIYRRVPARRIVARDHKWFTTTVNAAGPHIAVWVDGYQVTDWTDPRPASDNPREGLRAAPGTIAIQGHDPTTNLRFRNLRISELPERAK